MDSKLSAAGTSTVSQAPTLSEVLDQLWNKFLPQMLDRISTVEQANRALVSGKLTTELRAEAHSAAHKLAGSLGTFGLETGTALAREAEFIYSSEGSLDTSSTRLVEVAEQLRNLIAKRR